MHSIYYKFFYLFFFYLIILLFTGCAIIEKNSWDKCEKINTYECWKKYVKNFPGTPKTELAHWKMALASNSVEDYRNYLQHYPNGSYAETAYWKIAEIEDTVEAYRDYLHHSPNGVFAESSYWRIAILNNSVEDYRNYLQHYPNGSYAETAYWKIAEIEDTVEAYRDYLHHSPNGKNAEKATWRIANILNTIETYQLFINNFPESSLKDDAKGRILFLLAKKSPSIINITRFLSSYSNIDKNFISVFEYKKILNTLKDLSFKNKSAVGFIELFKQTGNKRFLAEAFKFKESIPNLHYESYLVGEFPEKYFFAENCVSGPGKDDPTTVYNCELRSKAKFGTYPVKIKFALPIKVSHKIINYGFFEKEVSEENETIEKYIVEMLPPLSTKKATVQFDPLKPSIEKSTFRTKETIRNIVGELQFEIIKFDESDALIRH